MRVAVFFGGRSYEHEVSVLTGLLGTKLLDEEALPIFVGKDNRFYDGRGRSVKDYAEEKKLPELNLTYGGFKGKFGKFIPVDVALNCCHGGLGEGGGLSALLEWFGIPSASPSMTESALFQNKYLSKLAVRSIGVPTLDGVRIGKEEFEKKKLLSLSLAEKKGFPLILKPVRLGSSIGIEIVSSREELSSALEKAFRYDDEVLVETYLKEKRDLNCAVYEGERLVISEPEEVVSSDEILSYEEKYERERKVLPLSEELAKEVKALSARIYRRFSFHGVVRIDYLLCDGKVYFNELNVIPGSLAYYLFSPSLSEGKKMIKELINRRKEIDQSEIPSKGLLKRPEIMRLNSCKIR